MTWVHNELTIASGNPQMLLADARDMPGESAEKG